MTMTREHRILIERFLLGILIIFCVGWGFSERSFAQSTENIEENQSPQAENSLPAEKSNERFLAGDTVKTNRTNGTITFIGNAKFIQGEISTFCDTLAIYLDQNQEVEKAVATGNVRLITEDITITGEQGTFYNKDQKVEIEGTAKAWQGKNTITAHRILAFLDQKSVEAYGDTASERVIMTVYSQQPPRPSEESPEKPSENPSEQGLSPIVIESDILKYDDSDQKAIFTGKVMAIKDITEINSDEMIVYLTGTGEAEENDIEKIEITGNVRIVQENTTITGEKGTYFENEQQAVIEGSAEERAQAEDKTQNSLLKAKVIKISLPTNDIEAEGNVSIQTLITSNGKNK
jgi:lipopolysaccharide transport protein LptA